MPHEGSFSNNVIARRETLECIQGQVFILFCKLTTVLILYTLNFPIQSLSTTSCSVPTLDSIIVLGISIYLFVCMAALIAGFIAFTIHEKIIKGLGVR